MKLMLFSVAIAFLIISSCTVTSEKSQGKDQEKAMDRKEYNKIYTEGIDNMDNGKFADAIKCFKKIMGLFPNDSTLYYNTGLAYYSIENLDSALFYYNKTIELYPKFALAYTNRAQVLLGMDDLKYDLIVSDCKKAMELDSTSYLPYINYASAEFYSDNQSKAFEMIENGMKRFPDNIDLLIARISFYKINKDFKNAYADVCRITELYPNNMDALFERGLLSMELEQYKKAIADFDVLINTNEAFHNVYYNRAISKSKINDKAGACADFEKAVSMGMEADEYMTNYCK